MNVDPRIRGVFFDDQPSNFEDKHLCESVLNVRSRLGKRDKAVIQRFDSLKSWEEDGESMFYKDAGLTLEVLQQWYRYLSTEKSKHIRLVFFDWDRTLSTWDGLNGSETAAWIRQARQDGTWDALRETMFSSAKRAQVIVNLLSLLQTQRRVFIVTNQGEGKAIRAVLKALAEDYRLPNLAQISVMALKERNDRSKFEFFQSKLKQHCELKK